MLNERLGGSVSLLSQADQRRFPLRHRLEGSSQAARGRKTNRSVIDSASFDVPRCVRANESACYRIVCASHSQTRSSRHADVRDPSVARRARSLCWWCTTKLLQIGTEHVARMWSAVASLGRDRVKQATTVVTLVILGW